MTFLGVYSDAHPSVCAGRDLKGLYRRASVGEIAEFTGIVSSYGEPASPNMHIDGGILREVVEPILARLAQQKETR